MIHLSTIDYILIVTFFAITLFVGIYVSQKIRKKLCGIFPIGTKYALVVAGFIYGGNYLFNRYPKFSDRYC